MECSNQTRSKELDKSTRFHRLVYSEIEEIGWEHLVRLSGDLTLLSLRVLDKKGRVHHLEIQLDKAYPKSPPSISAEVPYIYDLEWSIHSRLKNVVQQFQEHLNKLQEFWSTLKDIDKTLFVDSKMSSLSSRSIDIGNDCFIVLSIVANDPRSLPEIRFVGSGQLVNIMRKNWQRNSKLWSTKRSFLENLECLLATQLPRRPDVQKNDQEVECGICYSQSLPIDEELGDKSGSGIDYTCENTNCNRAFHSVCLGDWLRSITTTRQSFNVLFGNCPYCSEPIAVKINIAKQ
ncbi:E3 ubiquitin-protein ligase FANCL isoform X2 [Morus notabilis]|uniref:E3 ubiquitin-protein ligase FANCL isoform X2 n=1 Tax=Morus notabilis TaxID=981085 RepID=UPI000CECEE3C|nr:E3 ubiquitin-protein ligase FANCL isoform X2 [Morus notabilis]